MLIPLVDFAAPSIDFLNLAPIVAPLVAGALSVLIEAFVPRGARRPIQLSLVFGTLLSSLGSVAAIFGLNSIEAGGSVAIDGPGVILQGTIAIVAILGALVLAERKVDPFGDSFAPSASVLPGSSDERELTAAGWYATEIWAFFLFAVAGMQLFVVSNDLLTMFIALEVMSLPLYLLAGMARRRRLLSQEAALKYFVLGAYSSAFFLFGSALVYGFASSIDFAGIATAINSRPINSSLLVAGMAFLFVGLLFKVGSAPFHQWTPDVYQGAPTTLTAFMAAGVKVAAFGALLRLSYSAFGSMIWDWRPILWVIAVVTMFIGSLVALWQTDIKRMLAYSSVAHAGFILVGIISGSSAGIVSVVFYLITYAFTTLGIFTLVSLIRGANGEANNIDSWRGLSQRSPLTSAAITFFMVALAGLPLTSGFTAKFAVFSSAVQADQMPLVLLAIAASAIAVVFYLRIVVLMYFVKPQEEGASVTIPSGLTIAAVVVSLSITLILGVYPQPLLDLISQSPVFAR
jgi:NADH-quinone oxidoreductase subunit N